MGGFIGTDDSAAINACMTSAIAAQGVCYLPGGTTYYYAKSAIFNTTTNGVPFEIAGDTMDITRIVFPPFAFNTNLVNIQATQGTMRDISFDPAPLGVNTANNTSASGALVQLNTFYSYRVRVNNWNGNGTQPCIEFATDGVQPTELESSNCAVGVLIAATGISMFRPKLFGTVTGLRNFDASTNIYGGSLKGNTQALVSDSQGGVGTVYLYGVQFLAVGLSTITTVSGSTTWISGGIISGGKGCNTSGNSGGINNVSGAVIYIQDAQLCSHGTGTTITNAGTIFDDGGNTFPTTGAGVYSGAGAYIGQASTTFNSTIVTAPKLVLSAGWGSTAAVTALSGGNSPIGFTVTNSGTGQGASPTITYTFPTPYLVAPLSCTATQTGGTNSTNAFTSSSLSATGVTFTYGTTPTAADTEIVQVTCVVS